ncbi:MAG: ribosome-associated translation inhibitor RaiA [Actinobacteria bacterium]|nr:ribosome-associated translation inhibitor RaiA [Actinomycetota bacterium]
MQLNVKGKNMPVTDALFEHAERKLERLTRILPPWDEAPVVELELSIERNPKIDRPQTAEVTVRAKGTVLRVRETAEDMYVAIDHAARKLERQAVRYRERRRRHHRGHGRATEPAEAEDLTPIPELQHEAEAEFGSLVKTKRHAMPPMAVDEALLQMDMLHHDFYVFRNEENGGEINVVYRRGDGDYGLIVPQD